MVPGALVKPRKVCYQRRHAPKTGRPEKVGDGARRPQSLAVANH